VVRSNDAAAIPALFRRVSSLHPDFVETLVSKIQSAAGSRSGESVTFSGREAETLMSVGICFLLGSDPEDAQIEYTLNEPWILEAGLQWTAKLPRRV